MADRPDLRGRVAVVTGGASGIGAALVAALSAAGARVAVNDLAAVGAERVAARAGGVAVPGDAASEAGVRDLLAATEDRLGPVDVYFANAGVGFAGGPEAPLADWQESWRVNVMAHVIAARQLLPGWLAAGRGHFVATVSAAGLLSMPGSAAYSVTKHGALAFAEWLALTYAHRGIRVQAICPQGVRTPMLAASGAVGDLVLGAAAIGPEQVADLVVGSLAAGPFLLLPHPEVAGHYAGRAADPDSWLVRMNRGQQRIEAALRESGE